MKKLKLFGILSLVFVLALQNVAFAENKYTPQDYQKQQILFYDDRALTCAEGGSQAQQGAGLTPGATVYIMGDSITAQSKTAYEQKFEAAGFKAFVNGLSSRTLAGQNPSPNGLEQLKKDSSVIGSAGAVVIALGTNSTPTKEQIKSAINEVRAVNKSAPIYWVDTAVVNRPAYADLILKTNKVIYSEAVVNNYQVISWFKTVFSSADPTASSVGLVDSNKYISTADGLNVHPTQKGVDALVNTVFTKVNGSGVNKVALANTSIKFALPATKGQTGAEQAIDENGRLTAPDNNGSQGRVSYWQHAKLGSEYRDYYITMRWTTHSWNWQGNSKVVDSKQIEWLSEAPRIVLVTNQRTGKSIYAAVLESGPGPSVGTQWRADHGNSSAVTAPYWQGFIVGTPEGYDGLVSGFPPKALDALDAKTGYGKDGDELTYQWAPDQNVKPGPTDQTAAANGGVNCGNQPKPGVNGWDLTNMVVYDQFDPKYAKEWYGRTIDECGCGPTSMAMAMATLLNDKSITPTVVADYYGHNGGLDVGGCGSNWSWEILQKKWPQIKIESIGTDPQKAIQTIKNGGFVLVSYTGKPFAPDDSGHFFLIRSVTDSGNFYVANPLGKFAGVDWANQNTTEWDGAYLSSQLNDKQGFLKSMWAVTK